MAQKMRCGDIWTPSGRQYDSPYAERTPGDQPPLLPSIYDDEFDDDLIDAKWAWRNQGAATIAEKNGVQTLVVPTSATTNGRIREQAAPAGDFTLSAKLAIAMPRANLNNKAGICCVSSVTNPGRVLVYGWNAAASPAFSLDRWTSPTAFSATPWTYAVGVPVAVPTIYLRIQNVSSTLSFWWSPDGYTWVKAHETTETIAAHLGSLDKIGFFVNCENATLAAALDVHWFRVTTP